LGEQTKHLITYAKLSELEKLLSHFEDRKSRARERLLAGTSPSHWCFAIVGIGLSIDTAEVSALAQFQRVTEPPGEVELAGACKDPTVFGAVGRYSRGIALELAVLRSKGLDQGSFTLAWWIVSGLRVRSCSEILVVAVSDHSWSTIAGIDDRTCHVQLLEDHPRAYGFKTTAYVSEPDLEWLRIHLDAFGNLLENPQFRLAVDSLCTYHQMASKRMGATMLWSGIEALFAINAELRFRLAACIAATLEVRGNQRIDCYKRVKRL
jgi:hypothetical protein